MKSTKQYKRSVFILTKTNLFIFFLFSFFFLNSYLLIKKVSAQSAISLSVSPPILELMIQPGKTVKQTYTISNDGNNTNLIPKIVYFTPADSIGNIDLTDSKAPDWISFDQKTSQLTISPPENAEEIDHFLTLIFETKEPVDLLNQNSTSLVSQIGSNILLTISKDGNPKKSAEIVEFSAPRLVDSFYPISYSLTLANNGNSFWKPNGKIVTNKETLKLAPQNIISGSSRKIFCIDNENLINCNLQSRFHLGKIESKLEFLLDNDPKIYKAETVTYSFPFILILAFIILGIIFKLWRRKK
ncbi:MAG: hypothetical protein ACD_19C00426G0016 [uncultured bacterium]|nr:MAG: hypothetical protein ACD_19C00426G0016 [uncultured bacterium]